MNKMNRADEVYYEIKSLKQSYDFYKYLADRSKRGAKVRVKNILKKIAVLHEEQLNTEWSKNA